MIIIQMPDAKYEMILVCRKERKVSIVIVKLERKKLTSTLPKRYEGKKHLKQSSEEATPPD